MNEQIQNVRKAIDLLEDELHELQAESVQQVQHEMWYDLLKGCLDPREAKQLKGLLQTALNVYESWEPDTQKQREADKLRKTFSTLRL